MTHAVTRCDNCGESDDHPKLHYGAETYHHDHIPARVLDDLDIDGHLGEIIKAAKAGKHGDELRAHIHKTHPDTKKAARS